MAENIPEELKEFLNKFGIEIDNPEEIPLEKGPNTQMTDPGFYFDILTVSLPVETKTEKDPFDTRENKERIRKSIVQLETTGGMIHDVDLDK